jgi:hypothetical protein
MATPPTAPCRCCGRETPVTDPLAEPVCEACARAGRATTAGSPPAPKTPWDAPTPRPAPRVPGVIITPPGAAPPPLAALIAPPQPKRTPGKPFFLGVSFFWLAALVLLAVYARDWGYDEDLDRHYCLSKARNLGILWSEYALWLAVPLLFVWVHLYRGWVEDSRRGLMWGSTVLLIALALCAAIPAGAWVADWFANAVRSVPGVR